MKKNTPILIVGFGSIGERHWRNLKLLGYTNLSVYDTDHKKVKRAGATVVPTLSLAACKRFAIALICNPTHLHVPTARMAVRAGCHVFIEKPLSDTPRGADVLLREVRKHKVVAMIASNFRFDKQFETLERIIASRRLGAPLYASVTFTRDLARTAHYQKTYAAARKGGGVLFDLGPHVVEYLDALFGPVAKVQAVSDNRSKLEIANEDFVAGVFAYASGVRALFELDYFSNPKRHRLEVQCERGMAKVDFTSSDRNDMYLKQLKHFFACIDTKESPRYDLVRGIRVLKVLQSTRTAAQKGKEITV